MPIVTPNYNLTAFTWGDIYSSSSDRKRFLTIDNQMDFFSNQVGDGRIDGWNVFISDLNLREIKVSSGSGMISKNIVNTYGLLKSTLDNDKTFYVYMKQKSDIVGGFSGYTNMGSLLYNDSIFPDVPSNVSLVATGAYQVDISWDANTEIDFDHYVVLRSINDIDFVEIATTTNIIYSDITVHQDTLYYYKINAVDINGNISVSSIEDISFAEPSVILGNFVTTLKDLDAPINPIFFQVFSGENSVQLLWDFSPSSNLRATDTYRIDVQPLDSNYEPNGDVIINFVGQNMNYYISEDLLNNISYLITLYAVNFNGVLSEGITLTSTPRSNESLGEVKNVNITFSEGVNEDFNVEMDIDWNFELDPYFDLNNPDRFLITIIENGSKESEPIIVLGENSRNLNIKVISFRNDDNEIFYESVKENALYTVVVQSSNLAGNISNGIIVRTSSPIFNNPNPVTVLSIERQEDNSMIVSWANTTSSFFSHNLANLKIVFFNDPSLMESIILDDKNIDQSVTYIIDKDLFAPDIRYEFSIDVVDIFGNKSITKTVLFSTTDDVIFEKPGVPNDQNISSLEEEIELSWGLMDIGEISTYKIYRATHSVFLTPSSFFLLDEVPSTITNYSDFDISVGVTYAYFVTAVNEFNEESLNPINDNYAAYPLLLGSPKESLNLVSPSNLSISQSGSHSVQLDWVNTGGSFDGYQIFRSIGNKYSFEQIGSVVSSEISFLDENTLKEATTYFYLVRKYRNESELNITEFSIAPDNSIIIAKIITSIVNSVQSISIDQTVIFDIKNLEDPIKLATQDKINIHKHILDVKIDRRVDLNTDIIIDNWTTSNFSKYITVEDIEGASNYIINVSGDVNREFFKDKDGNVDESSVSQAEKGTPPLLFGIDTSEGSIVFEGVLFSSSEEVVSPYISPPVISMKMINISETKNNLFEEKIESISTANVLSGQISKEQLPNINHEGRLDETLIPKSVDMTTLDNFVYTFTNKDIDPEKNLMGDSIAFYDILKIENESFSLLAATSNGLLFSKNDGSEWIKKFDFPTAIFKLFYSSMMDIYFGLTSQGVYYRKEKGFSNWKLMLGTEQVKIIRDIIEDNDGNAYVSTDLGVYILKKSNFNLFFQWEQLFIFGPRSTEAYALLYDTNEDRILVSNELGILESFNNGSSWNFTSEFSELKNIFKFIQLENRIFALTNRELWRRIPGRNFEKIADLDVDVSRNMIIFNNIIYISTDNGIISSREFANIFNDEILEFSRVFPEINEKNNDIIITSLSIIEENLYIGTDRKLYIVDNNKNIWIQFKQINATIPSIYIDGELQKLGFYYNNGDDSFNNLSFDEKIDFDKIITVANKYDEYIVPNFGWSTSNFKSKISLKLNEIVVSESTIIELDKTLFFDFQFPTYTDVNANSKTALLYQEQTETLIIDLLNLSETVSSQEEVDLVSDIMNSIELFYSQLYPETRVIVIVNEDGTTTTIPTTFPNIFTNLSKKTGIDDNGEDIFISPDNIVVVDITEGTFSFQNAFDKYDQLSVDIFGSTLKNIGDLSHKELEDDFEFANSGLPSSLSQIQHSNLIKLGIFNEKKFPNQMENFIDNIQSKYIIPRDKNFYDNLNSTVDYNIEVISDEISLSLSYAMSVEFVSYLNKICVGGDGGILSIDINTLEIEEVTIDIFKDNFVKKILLNEEILYVVSEKNIYSSEGNLNSWILLDRTGLPNELFTLAIIKNNLVVGGSDGVYFKSFSQDGWDKAIDSNSPIEIMISPDMLFVVVDNEIYSTTNGSNFIKLNHNDIGQINSISKHKTGFFIATNNGLFTDGGSFYSKSTSLSLVDVENNFLESASIIFNDVFSDNSSLVTGTSKGKYYKFENNVFSSVENSLLETLHKVLLVNEVFWFFGYNLFQVEFLDFPILLTTGVPA